MSGELTKLTVLAKSSTMDLDEFCNAFGDMFESMCTEAQSLDLSDMPDEDISPAEIRQRLRQHAVRVNFA